MFELLKRRFGRIVLRFADEPVFGAERRQAGSSEGAFAVEPLCFKLQFLPLPFLLREHFHIFPHGIFAFAPAARDLLLFLAVDAEELFAVRGGLFRHLAREFFTICFQLVFLLGVPFFERFDLIPMTGDRLLQSVVFLFELDRFFFDRKQLRLLFFEFPVVLFEKTDVFFGGPAAFGDPSAHIFELFLQEAARLFPAAELLLLECFFQFLFDAEPVFIGKEGEQQDGVRELLCKLLVRTIDLPFLFLYDKTVPIVRRDVIVESDDLFEVFIHAQNVGLGDGRFEFIRLGDLDHERRLQEVIDAAQDAFEAFEFFALAVVFAKIGIVFPHFFEIDLVFERDLAVGHFFLHGRFPAVGVRQLDDPIVTDGNEIGKAEKHHIEEAVLIDGVIVEPLYRIELFGHKVAVLVFPRDEIAVAGQMLHRFPRDMLDLFDGRDFAFRTDELTFFVDGFFNKSEPALDLVQPIGLDGTGRADRADAVLPIGFRGGGAQGGNFPFFGDLSAVFPECAVKTIQA